MAIKMLILVMFWNVLFGILIGAMYWQGGLTDWWGIPIAEAIIIGSCALASYGWDQEEKEIHYATYGARKWGER